MAYDPRAVKLPKEVKRVADRILDRHLRGSFIRSYVQILEGESRARTQRNRGEAKDTQ